MAFSVGWLMKLHCLANVHQVFFDWLGQLLSVIATFASVSPLSLIVPILPAYQGVLEKVGLLNFPKATAYGASSSFQP